MLKGSVMQIFNRMVFIAYLFLLSYSLFSNVECNERNAFSVNGDYILLLGKGVLIGIMFFFVDRKYLFFMSTKDKS